MGLNDKNQDPPDPGPLLCSGHARLPPQIQAALFMWRKHLQARPASGLPEILIHPTWPHQSNTTSPPTDLAAGPVLHRILHLNMVALTCEKTPHNHAEVVYLSKNNLRYLDEDDWQLDTRIRDTFSQIYFLHKIIRSTIYSLILRPSNNRLNSVSAFNLTIPHDKYILRLCRLVTDKYRNSSLSSNRAD